jgi:hypothetical protein
MMTRPVFIWYMAGAWITLSAQQERISAISSAWACRCGTRSDMSTPDWPYLPHFRWLPRQSGSASRNWLWILPKLGGRAWPSSRLRSGFGSKRSTWLGPPVMNRKMHAWPWRGSGQLVASGLVGEPAGTSRQQIGQAEHAEPTTGDLEELRLRVAERLWLSRDSVADKTHRHFRCSFGPYLQGT